MTDFFASRVYRHTLIVEAEKSLSVFADGVAELAYYWEAFRQYVAIGECGVLSPVLSGIEILHRVAPQQWLGLRLCHRALLRMDSVVYDNDFLRRLHVEKVSEEFFSANVEVAGETHSYVQRQTSE